MVAEAGIVADSLVVHVLVVSQELACETDSTAVTSEEVRLSATYSARAALEPQ